MVAILSRWSEQSGACTGGEYSDVPATHPFCGESGWMATAGISRRYNAGTFRPSGVVTRQVALAVPIHPHRRIPVSWSYFLGAATAMSVSGHRESRAGGHRGRSRGQHGAWRSTSAAQAMRRASRYVTFDAGGHNLPPRTALTVAGRGAAVAGLSGTGPASPGTALLPHVLKRARPRVTCVQTPVKAPLCADGSGPQALVTVERPQRSEDVRP
jgi:S-layer homology domain